MECTITHNGKGIDEMTEVRICADGNHKKLYWKYYDK